MVARHTTPHHRLLVQLFDQTGFHRFYINTRSLHTFELGLARWGRLALNAHDATSPEVVTNKPSLGGIFVSDPDVASGDVAIKE
jgi:hypothetical protein